MHLTPRNLIAAALAEPADSHERWSHVRVLHERGDEATFRAALDLLESSEPAARVLGADIIGQVGSIGEVPVEKRQFRRPGGEVLVAQVEREKNPEVLAAIAHAFGHLREERAIPALFALRNHLNPSLRHAVASGLFGLDDDLAVITLVELSRDSEDAVRDWATFGLSTQIERDDDLVRNALLARIEDSDQNIRVEALRGLGSRGDKRAVGPLLTELERPATADDPSILYEALFALAVHATDVRLCRAVEMRGRRWQAEQPADNMADRLNIALQHCANSARLS